jgi:hypothetical protein
MKLRYLQTLDKNGNKSKPVLQYWDENGDFNLWQDVNLVTVQQQNEDDANKDPNMY